MTETLSRALSPAAHPVRSPATPGTAASSGPAGLTTARGVALYIGALLGPGLLLLPGLAAAEAGPASVLAWAGLLILSGLFAVVFGSLGRGFPSAGGVIGYVRAGLGARASAIAGWSFLAGVIAGAPVVCLIGAGYVTELTGGGRLARALIAALLLLAVMGLVAGGLRASATAQLLLVGLLLAVVVVAVAGVRRRVARRQLGTVRAARLAGGRARGLDPHALLRRLGGGRAADHAVHRPGTAAAARHRQRPGRHQRALPGPGDRHDQRPRHRGGDQRAARRAAAGRGGPGGDGRRRRRGGRADARRGQRLRHRCRRDGRRADAAEWRPHRGLARRAGGRRGPRPDSSRPSRSRAWR